MWQQQEELSPWAVSKPGRFGMSGHIECGAEAPNQRSLYLQVFEYNIRTYHPLFHATMQTARLQLWIILYNPLGS